MGGLASIRHLYTPHDEASRGGAEEQNIPAIPPDAPNAEEAIADDHVAVSWILEPAGSHRFQPDLVPTHPGGCRFLA
jgi:hypothetical protein